MINSMKIIIGIIITMFIIFVIAYMVLGYKTQTYVRGKYGKHCYTVQNQNKNIKHPIYFKSLQECLETL